MGKDSCLRKWRSRNLQQTWSCHHKDNKTFMHSPHRCFLWSPRFSQQRKERWPPGQNTQHMNSSVPVELWADGSSARTALEMQFAIWDGLACGYKVEWKRRIYKRVSQEKSEKWNQGFCGFLCGRQEGRYEWKVELVSDEVIDMVAWKCLQERSKSFPQLRRMETSQRARKWVTKSSAHIVLFFSYSIYYLKFSMQLCSEMYSTML